MVPANAGTAEIGAPCTSGNDCKTGLCIPETSQGQPTGYVGGYCLTFDARSPGNTFQPNMPFPRGNCPPNTANVPLSQGSGEGDQAACLSSCTRTNAQDIRGTCRPGYECNYAMSTSGMMSSTGFCDVFDCNTAPYNTQPNNACPTGYRCQTRTVGTRTVGSCVSSSGGDAGADSGSGDSGSGTDSGSDSATDTGAGGG